MGALCMTAIEHEIKRGELWTAEALRDDLSAKKYRLALRKQNVLLAGRFFLYLKKSYIYLNLFFFSLYYPIDQSG